MPLIYVTQVIYTKNKHKQAKSWRWGS